MKNQKRIIVIDFDDTILKSSEIVIDILNEKNKTQKTIADLSDWNYRSIDPKITTRDVDEIYSSDSFWQRALNIKYLNDGIVDFFNSFKNDFKFIVCSVGTEENLRRKENFIKNLGLNLGILGLDISLLGIPQEDKHLTGNLDKSCFDFSSCYLFIDDNTKAVQSVNAPKKILVRNNRNVLWNKKPINDEKTYCVNTFNEIVEMIKFDLEVWSV